MEIFCSTGDDAAVCVKCGCSRCCNMAECTAGSVSGIVWSDFTVFVYDGISAVFYRRKEKTQEKNSIVYEKNDRDTAFSGVYGGVCARLLYDGKGGRHTA